MDSTLSVCVLLVACFSSVLGYAREEPSNSCTRMVFEETMLEKMVVVQHTVKTTLADVKTELDKFSTETVKFAESISTFRADMTEQMNTFKTDMTAELKAVKAEMTEEMGVFQTNTSASLTQQTTEQEKFTRDVSMKYKTMVDRADRKLLQIESKIQNQTQELQDKLLQDPIAFIIRFDSDTIPVAGNILKFNTVVLNVGDAYSTSDGTFTAPVSGVYMLSAQVCMDLRVINYSIQSATRVYSRSRHGDKDYDDVCSSVTTAAVLEKGERVYVWCTSTDAAGSFLETKPPHYWSMFSGAFIHPAP